MACSAGPGERPAPTHGWDKEGPRQPLAKPEPDWRPFGYTLCGLVFYGVLLPSLFALLGVQMFFPN